MTIKFVLEYVAVVIGIFCFYIVVALAADRWGPKWLFVSPEERRRDRERAEREKFANGSRILRRGNDHEFCGLDHPDRDRVRGRRHARVCRRAGDRLETTLMASHYVPMWTERNGRMQKSVCGLWIENRMHSNEPTCDDCAKWLLADAADTRTEEDLFGTPDPADVVPVEHFNPIAHYRPRR